MNVEGILQTIMIKGIRNKKNYPETYVFVTA